MQREFGKTMGLPFFQPLNVRDLAELQTLHLVDCSLVALPDALSSVFSFLI